MEPEASTSDNGNKRKQLSTELRTAIWEAHKKRCPYTGDLIAFTELDIDHVIPIAVPEDEFARLVREKIIASDFDLNGLSNLLPTKRFQNGRKSDGIRGNSVLIHFLDIAEQHRAVVAERLSSSIEDRKLLNAYPRVTCRDLDRWSSAWIHQVWIEFDEPEDSEMFERCKTVADLVAEGACKIVRQDDWHVAIEPRKGLAVAVSELFRADLDGDGAEEILVFDLAYAPEGTLRAGSVRVAKPDIDGILQPVAEEAANIANVSGP